MADRKALVLGLYWVTLPDIAQRIHMEYEHKKQGKPRAWRNARKDKRNQE